MIKRFMMMALIVNLLTFSAHAAEIVVAEKLVFEIDIAEGWSLNFEPPDALVKETASHVAHEPAAANATAEQIERVARKRLAANEAIVYHAVSGAHLDIDFAPLDPGQSAPSSKTLRNSAEYAAQSLEGEEDISEVVWDVSKVEIDGAERTFLLSADYNQHGHPVAFLGYIGYVENYWFFLYFTTPAEEPAPLEEMRSMLARASIRQTGH